MTKAKRDTIEIGLYGLVILIGTHFFLSGPPDDPNADLISFIKIFLFTFGIGVLIVSAFLFFKKK